MSHRGLAILALSLSLGACATSGELAPTPEEQALSEELQARSIVPASAAEREAIVHQDLLTQAAFWAEAFELNPGDADAALNLSNVLRQLNNAERAGEVARQALALHPENIDLQAAYGLAMTSAGRGSLAVEPLTRATRSRPDNWTWINALGVALEQSGRSGAARTQFEQALLLSGGAPGPLNNLALSQMLSGSPEQAETLLRRAMDQNTANAQIRQNLALALALQGQFAEAQSIALIDATPEMARANMDYVRSMMNSTRRYDSLRAFDDPNINR